MRTLKSRDSAAACSKTKPDSGPRSSNARCPLGSLLCKVADASISRTASLEGVKKRKELSVKLTVQSKFWSSRAVLALNFQAPSALPFFSYQPPSFRAHMPSSLLSYIFLRRAPILLVHITQDLAHLWTPVSFVTLIYLPNSLWKWEQPTGELSHCPTAIQSPPGAHDIEFMLFCFVSF